MNRERLLFVSVVAILVLWFLVIRESVEVETDVSPGKLSIQLSPVRGYSRTDLSLRYNVMHGIRRGGRTAGNAVFAVSNAGAVAGQLD